MKPMYRSLILLKAKRFAPNHTVLIFAKPTNIFLLLNDLKSKTENSIREEKDNASALTGFISNR